MISKDSAQLREEYGQRLQAELDRLSAGNSGILAAQVCTSDGFAVASVQRSAESHRRLAAMVSSLQALGAAVVEETELGDYCNLIIEATHGKCAIMAVPGSIGDILLTAIGDAKLSYGIFLVLCKNTCHALGERLGTVHS